MAKFRGYTKFIGYCWRYCPFSTAYDNKYYSNGHVGNTTNSGITTANFTTIVTADHTTTEGTMVMHNPGGCPGWLCLDDDCPYYIDNGVRYFET